MCLGFHSTQYCYSNKSRAEKRHLLAAAWPAEWEQKRTSLLRRSVTVQPDSMQKQMVHLVVEATRRDTDKPQQRQQPSLELTVIIQRESAELHAVCQHRLPSRSYTSTHSHWQTTTACYCQLQRNGGPSSVVRMAAKGEGGAIALPAYSFSLKLPRIHTSNTVACWMGPLGPHYW